MRVKLFRKETIQEYKLKHSNAERHFETFLCFIQFADWEEPRDIIKTVKGNLLGNGSDRVVFDLGGNGSNSFRVICKYAFKPFKKRVYLYVLWVGSHEQYNALTKENKLTVWNY